MMQITIAAAAAPIISALGQVTSTANCQEASQRFVRATLPKRLKATFILLAAAALIAILSPSSVNAQPRSPQEPSGMGKKDANVKAGTKTRRWPVKIYSAELPHMYIGTLEISPSTVTVKQEDGSHREIPIDKVVEVAYDNTSHSKSRGWLNAAGGIAQTPFAIGVYPVAAPLVGAAIVAPFKTRTHFVRILWNDAETGSTEVNLEIGKGDYARVLADLQSLTGKPWLNLPAERKKLREATDAAKTSTVPSAQTK